MRFIAFPSRSGYRGRERIRSGSPEVVASGVIANLHGRFEWLRLRLDDAQANEFGHLFGDGLDLALAYG